MENLDEFNYINNCVYLIYIMSKEIKVIFGRKKFYLKKKVGYEMLLKFKKVN